MPVVSIEQIAAWDNLVKASFSAARSKKSKQAVAHFELYWADRLLDVQQNLLNGRYKPGKLTHFHIRQPKFRKISAAPFVDRVVHHALVSQYEPWFESRFIGNSFANRKGRGTHRAIDKMGVYCRQYKYCLRLDVVKHFQSIDHDLLFYRLNRLPARSVTKALNRKILSAYSDESEEGNFRFPGDDLFSVLRPRGLPIGNLTSQFWSNVFMDELDQFVLRDLRCAAYLRYVDDIALLSNSKRQLLVWRQAIESRLLKMRLRIHENSSQALKVQHGVPWLGFVIYPAHRLPKARVVRNAQNRLKDVFYRYGNGDASFGELDQVVRGWDSYLEFGDTWGLRLSFFKDVYEN